MTADRRPPIFVFPARLIQQLARFGVILAVGLFLCLGAYQLQLPGLHYDEAKEAGLNAMQLVTGQPVTAFRDTTAQFGPWRLPLMVQDYIGGLNVLLAVPFLALSGVNVVALRWLPLLTAGLTLLLTARIAHRLGGPLAALVTALLLAVNPSFIFWSRQGVFVTNLTALIFMASLLTGLHWWSGRKPADLWLTAFLWGLGIYAKLLFVWAVTAMVGVALLAWLLEARSWKREAGNGKGHMATSSQPPASSFQSPASNLQPPTSNLQRQLLTWGGAIVAFLLPLIPLILFNIRTSGTLISLFGNLGRSYYGVDNTAYLPNLLTRLKQLVTLLRGDHFWYLGGVFDNAWAPWLAGAALAVWGSVGVWVSGRLGVWVKGRMGVWGNGRLGVWVKGRIGEKEFGSAGEAIVRVPSNLQSPTSNLQSPTSNLQSAPTLPPSHTPTLPHSHTPLLPLALLALIIAQSAFTVSDLFITHYALLLPLIPLAAGLAVAGVWTGGRRQVTGGGGQEAGVSAPEIAPTLPHSHTPTPPHPHTPTLPRSQTPPLLRAAVLVAVLLWVGGDLWTTVRYHRALAASGGHAGHSDAIGELANYLERGGLSAPVTLDWGMDAPVRFLTAGRVNPIEVFGYAPLDTPDPGFAARLNGFLENPASVYLAHAAEATVFRGRVEALAALTAGRGLVLREEIRFDERSGRPLFVIYRAGRP